MKVLLRSAATLVGVPFVLALPINLAAASSSAGATPVVVTIQADGVDISGTVRSARPARCADARMVKVYKLVDGDPHLWSTDTTQRVGGAYVWSIGNTGVPGRFYATVGAKPGCRADRSSTIRVSRAE